MAKKRRVVMVRPRRHRSRRPKGILGGIKLYDVSQGLYNVDKLGYIDAGQAAMNGDLTGASAYIVQGATEPANVFGLAVGNLWIGITRKIVHKTGGRFVRQYIA